MAGAPPAKSRARAESGDLCHARTNTVHPTWKHDRGLSHLELKLLASHRFEFGNCGKSHTAHSTLHSLQFTLYTPHTTLYKLHIPHFTLHTLHSTLCTPHSTLFTPHSRVYSLHSTLYTLHSTLCTPPSSAFHSLQCTGTVTGKNVQDCSNNLFHTSVLCDCIRVRGLHLVFEAAQLDRKVQIFRARQA